MTNNRGRKTEITIGLVVIGFFLIYAAWNARLFIAGPELIIESPADQLIVTSDMPIVKISGTAKRGISELKINGGKSFVNADGLFQETYPLILGENRFTITARDRFDREASISRTVWLVPVNKS